ncbi:hypothetical protein BJX99DRAFT_254228 [Aspergillus californicus]
MAVNEAPLWTPYTPATQAQFVFDATPTSYIMNDDLRTEGVAYIMNTLIEQRLISGN